MVNPGKSKFRDLLPICKCGHGKVHHDGKYGECTCDMGRYKNEKICRCPNYKMDIHNRINQNIIEWNDKLAKKAEGKN